MQKTKKKLIESILTRGIIKEILPDSPSFKKVLNGGKKLRFYIGADPTSNTLHLSHAKNYMLLEEFRLLGHEVIVLFGDFTASIGDPTDRDSVRQGLSVAEIQDNVKGWTKQIKPLMKFDDVDNPPRILFNGTWLSKLRFEDVVKLASNITVQRMLERDMFEKRIKDQKPIFMHEFMYPLMQGYDSVAMDVDVELCGTDQIFNALVGRNLQKRLNNKEKFVVAVNLMENPKTGDLMSKSKGTGVFLNSSPNDMYGSIMALPDEMTEVVLLNNTRIPLKEIQNILSLGPRDAKMRAALKVVSIFHGDAQAHQAEQHFIAVIQKKLAPSDMPNIEIGAGEHSAFAIVRACLPTEFSNSEINRLFTQNGIKLDNSTVSDKDCLIILDQNSIEVKIGKRKWFRVSA